VLNAHRKNNFDILSVQPKYLTDPLSSDDLAISGSRLTSEGDASLNSTLTCNATSYEGATLTYTWTDSQQQEIKGPNVTLLVPGSDLKYTCTVENEVGKANKMLLVSVRAVEGSERKGRCIFFNVCM